MREGMTNLWMEQTEDSFCFLFGPTWDALIYEHYPVTIYKRVEVMILTQLKEGSMDKSVTCSAATHNEAPQVWRSSCNYDNYPPKNWANYKCEEDIDWHKPPAHSIKLTSNPRILILKINWTAKLYVTYKLTMLSLVIVWASLVATRAGLNT